MMLSIIIPVYNEESTIGKVIQRVIRKDFGLKKEIIVINDGSTDKTGEILRSLKYGELRVIDYRKNKGKGYAIRKGIEKSKGTVIAIQDADLEYNLEDLRKIVKIVVKENLRVVYGSRFLKMNKKYKKNSFYFANRLLSLITSALYLQKITDMETCYKVIKKEVLEKIKLECNRFDIEPEITTKIIKLGIHIKEIPIDYKPRTAKEGKKIRWKDGFVAIWILIRERFTR